MLLFTKAFLCNFLSHSNNTSLFPPPSQWCNYNPKPTLGLPQCSRPQKTLSMETANHMCRQIHSERTNSACSCG